MKRCHACAAVLWMFLPLFLISLAVSPTTMLAQQQNGKSAVEGAPISPVAASTDYALGWSNRYGVRDGFGSQGLSAADYVACVTHNCDTPPLAPPYNSASNWHPKFLQYNTHGVPLELQPIALSYPGDTDCTSPVCGVTTYSGDLPTFLYPFATSAGGTDFEIYWRDLSLAYDGNNYCKFNTMPPPPPFSCAGATSVTPGNQINPPTLQVTFFQAVGQGNNPSLCGNNMPQTGSTGNCSYANNINHTHAQH